LLDGLSFDGETFGGFEISCQRGAGRAGLGLLARARVGTTHPLWMNIGESEK
jgi:hypothetical protein